MEPINKFFLILFIIHELFCLYEIIFTKKYKIYFGLLFFSSLFLFIPLIFLNPEYYKGLTFEEIINSLSLTLFFPLGYIIPLIISIKGIISLKKEQIDNLNNQKLKKWD